ncbi:MAG: hypothetical protein FWD73_11980 [Polyangiaceae bacterium]|nr:hypothetical protein [Polyangiaceae bacterium]
MTESEPAYVTTPIKPSDAKTGFSCGNHALDDFFARHAVRNNEAGVGRVYVLRRDSNDNASLPVLTQLARALTRIHLKGDEATGIGGMVVVRIDEVVSPRGSRRRTLSFPASRRVEYTRWNCLGHCGFSTITHHMHGIACRLISDNYFCRSPPP